MGGIRKLTLLADFPSTDIVYNSTTDEWACCYTDYNPTRDCTRPGTEAFQAPPLLSLTQAPSYISMPTVPTTPTSQPVTSSLSKSGGLNSGAKAGIGMGVAIAGLSIITAMFLLLLRRRKKGMSAKSTTSIGGVQKSAQGRLSPEAEYFAPLPLVTGAEADRPQELPLVTEAGADRPQELH